MILDVGQCSRVAVLTRQAAILIRGVRPSYGWLAGAAPPAADRFDESRLLGWRVGCRMLSQRLAEAPDADSAGDPLLDHLADWVRFELEVETTRWTHIRPVAMLGASVFGELVDRDDTDPEVLAAWTATLEWCRSRCDTGEMKVDLADRWLLETWRDRADAVCGGPPVVELLDGIGRHAAVLGGEWSPPPLLRTADVPLVQTLLAGDRA